MKTQSWRLVRPWLLGLATLALASAPTLAQAPPVVRSGPFIENATPTAPSFMSSEAPPKSPSVSPGKLTLDQCLELGFRHQPAIDAARASLAAAESGKRGVDRLILPRLFRPDLPIRREQACHGVTIAAAGLTQAEWETRYAIMRNFFTVQYVNAQDEVVSDVLESLEKGYARAKSLFGSGDVEVKIKSVDLETIRVQLGIVKTKHSQVRAGREKALAALREAMGLAPDYPLEIASVPLPPATYVVRGPELDDKGKPVMKDGKVLEKDYFHILYPLTSQKLALIDAAVANRGEMIQASTASRITDLEVQAQRRVRGLFADTFAAGADLHAKPIPQGMFNGEYRPGAIGPEFPVKLIGRMRDRVQRASDFSVRATAVVEKATSLASLDVEAQYFKWVEAAEEVKDLREILPIAKSLPKRVQDLAPKEFTSSALIQANVTSVMVRTQLNDAEHTHALALAGLERATAGAFRVYPVPAPPASMPK
jgi:outer membrane protein TolC